MAQTSPRVLGGTRRRRFGEAGGKGDSLNEGATDHRQIGSALTSPIMLDPENWKIVFAAYKGRSIGYSRKCVVLDAGSSG